MKSFLPDFHIESAMDLKDALEYMASPKKSWRPMAGGTDLMVLFEAGKLKAGYYLDIYNLRELKGLRIDDHSVEIGALATYSDILENKILQTEFPLLCEAAKLTGALAIQNRGTLGGNIVNASPAADSPPALLVYEAEVELTSQSGARWIPLEKFYLGYKKTDIHRHELLTRIRFKRNTEGFKQHYRKVGTRKAQAISKVCMASVAQVNSGQLTQIRIAFGSVAPIPLRAKITESLINGQKLSKLLVEKACDQLAQEISPIDDIRSNQIYRKNVSVNLLKDFLESL